MYNECMDGWIVAKVVQRRAEWVYLETVAEELLHRPLPTTCLESPLRFVCLFVYLYRSSKYRYNEAYTIWNNELEQQGWLTSTNNCPSHTHAYTHTEVASSTSFTIDHPWWIASAWSTSLYRQTGRNPPARWGRTRGQEKLSFLGFRSLTGRVGQNLPNFIDLQNCTVTWHGHVLFGAFLCKKWWHLGYILNVSTKCEPAIYVCIKNMTYFMVYYYINCVLIKDGYATLKHACATLNTKHHLKAKVRKAARTTWNKTEIK